MWVVSLTTVSHYSTTVGSFRRRRCPQVKTPAAAGAALLPLAWQDVDLRRGCGGNASVNAKAVDDEDYNEDGGDNNDGDGGHNLALALAQPHPHPRNGEGDRDASPPSWRLTLNVEMTTTARATKRVTRVTKAAATTSNSDEELLSTYHSRKRERRCESC